MSRRPILPVKLTILSITWVNRPYFTQRLFKLIHRRAISRDSYIDGELFSVSHGGSASFSIQSGHTHTVLTNISRKLTIFSILAAISPVCFKI